MKAINVPKQNFKPFLCTIMLQIFPNHIDAYFEILSSSALAEINPKEDGNQQLSLVI